MDAYTAITRQQWQEIDDLLMEIRESLPCYASGEDYARIMRWAQDVDSREALWVLNDALNSKTMPPSSTEMALATQARDLTLVMDYIAVAHRLDGQTYSADQVLAAIRGMRDSPVTAGIDFTEETGLASATVMIKFMNGLAGSFIVASGNVGGEAKYILLGSEVAEMVLNDPDRVDDVIRFVKDRQYAGPDAEAESIVANDPSDISGVMMLVARRNDATTQLIREMLDSDFGALVDGML
jgi:hypothetical protein